MKKQFNEYMEIEAPIQLKVLFHEMNESQAIMLQECFHAFAKKVVSDVQSENGKLPIPHVSGSASERYRKALGYISEMTFEIEIGTEKGSDVLEKALRIASGYNVD